MLFIILVAVKSNAQIEDSITRNHRLVLLQQQLSLSDKQYQEMIVVYKQLLQDRDSVNALNLTPENRAVFLSEIGAKYHSALQSILSVEQWEIYDDKQKAMKQAFEQRIREQKIKYTFLNNQ